MGYMGIHLRGQRVAKYMPYQLSRSNKGWHSHWFYLKNDPVAPLPVFSERLIKEVPLSWSWGPSVILLKQFAYLYKQCYNKLYICANPVKCLEVP